MRTTFFILMIAAALSASAQNKFFQQWTKDSAFDGAVLGVLVNDVDKDTVLLSHNAYQNMITASTMKLITTAAGFKVLGPNYQFKTELAFSDSIVNGNLRGDLIIRGFGDPTLGSKYLFQDQNAFIKKWVEEIKKVGIKSITGNIIGDGSYFGNVTAPYGWQWSDISNYYGSPVSGLNIFDNQYTIIFKTGKVDSISEIKSVTPYIPYLQLKNHVLASAKSGDNSYILGGPNEQLKQIEGTLPANENAFEVKGSIPNPSLFLAYTLMEELKNAGININGTYGSHLDKTISKSNTFYTQLSPSLNEIAKITNKYSINFFAECIGLEVQKKMNSENYSQALEKCFGKEFGFNKNTILDASGLSPANTITPRNYYKVLKTMYADKNLKTYFFESLSVSGKDGTLKSFGSGKNFAGNFIGKSGYISNIRGYTGYLKTIKGKNLTVIILVNHYTSENSIVKGKIEDLVEYLYLNY
jgi:D-alanyl-D-alanine carboxypeptidase/D-alanyl-D-alanine-endopeptidase (penicillin-binding protein 4)